MKLLTEGKLTNMDFSLENMACLETNERLFMNFSSGLIGSMYYGSSGVAP